MKRSSSDIHHGFKFDRRLGIPIPTEALAFEQLSERERAEVLTYWEQIRGSIPDRILQLETEINQLQERLANSDVFSESCRINSEVADRASTINDLNLWFRVDESAHESRHHQ